MGDMPGIVITGASGRMVQMLIRTVLASDKARHVRSTEAEYLVAGDQACLMNIGGVLHRQRSGIKTIHLAEILASTEKEVAVA